MNAIESAVQAKAAAQTALDTALANGGNVDAERAALEAAEGHIREIEAEAHPPGRSRQIEPDGSGPSRTSSQ